MSKKILVIEDDHFMAQAYRLKLENAGFQVTVAYDGESGEKEALTNSYDTIILDLILPKRDGFDVLKSLRSNSRLAHTKIIVSSNLGQNEDKEKALALGADKYLAKTAITMADLVEMLE